MPGLAAFRLLFCLALALAAVTAAAPARACESCGCESAAHSMIRSNIRQEHQLTRQYIAREFQVHREQFILPVFFHQHIQPLLQLATEHLTAAAMHQMAIIGAMFDAGEFIESQRLRQDLTARAHKDYHPSTSFCEFGTMTRSLAAAQRNAEFASFSLARRWETRQSRAPYGSTHYGDISDAKSRLAQFRTRYCDTGDHNGGLIALCKQPAAQGPGQSAPPENRNKDVDYERLVAYPLSLSVDLARPNDTAANKDTQDLFALAGNLYGHSTFDYIPPVLFKTPENQPLYLDVRSVLAKRAVAQNSFDALVGMKVKGSQDVSEDTAKYMKAVFRQLGVDNDGEVTELLGDRPSYYAQMEVLTKKLYQRPEFYTNLYDKPANVERKAVAMRAIGLMQDMDRFKSQLRSEMLLSVILETELVKQDRDLRNRSGSIGSQEGSARKP